MNNEKILPSTYCPYCIGWTDESGFHHGLNCPTLADDISHADFQLSYISNREDRIIQLLESINQKLNKICHEAESIRIRIK